MKRITKLFSSSALAVAVALAFVIGALAAYTGPNRTTTVTTGYWTGNQVGQACRQVGGVWAWRNEDTCSCTDNTCITALHNDYGDPYPGPCTAANVSAHGKEVWADNCSWQTTTTTISLPPATVSGSVGCTTPGNSGWCRGGAVLNLSANEPMAGQTITGIESSGQGMLCTTAAVSPTCAWSSGIVEGTTPVTFWALSSYGDTSLQASQTIRLDTVAPAVTTGASGGTPGSNGWFVGGTRTLSASATDATSGVGTSACRLSGGSWSSPCTSVNISTDGDFTYEFQFTDVAGNSATQTIGARYDATPPSMTPGIVSGTLGGGGWYRGNVEMNNAATDAMSGVASAEISSDGVSYGASINLGEGTHTVYLRATDNAGNLATSTTTVRIDMTPPTLALTPAGTSGTNGWYVSNSTLTAASADALSGLASVEYRINGGAWASGTVASLTSDGTFAIDFRARDVAGNERTGAQTLRVDRTPPSVALDAGTPDGNGGWYISSFSAAALGTDATSGIASELISFDGATWQPTLAVGEGLHTLHLRAVDNAGNSYQTTVSVQVDLTRPTLVVTPTGTMGDNNWYTSSVNVNAASSDALSGLASVEYRVNGGAWTSGTNFNLSTDGVHSVEFAAEDNAGNVRTGSYTIRVDRTPPTVALAAPAVDGLGGWYVTNPVVTASASDATAGIASARVSLDGSTWSSSLTLPDGTHTVQLLAIDNAGNTRTGSAVVRVDTTPPTASIPLNGTLGSNGWFTSPVDVSISSADAASGVALEQYQIDGGGWVVGDSFTLNDGVFAVSAQVTDNAGNVRTVGGTVRVDTVGPTSSIDTPAGGDVVENTIELTGDSADATSGVDAVQISFDGGATWETVDVGPGGDWSYDWDTTLEENGTLTIIIVAIDNAGNLQDGDPTTIIVTIANDPPRIIMDDEWYIWDTGSLQVIPNSLPVDRVSVTIVDPKGRWSSAISNYGFENYPREIRWNRRFPGNILAPPGSYTVVAVACDSYDNCATEYGRILIPDADATITPTAMPTMTATPTMTSTPTQAATRVAPTRTAQPTMTALPTLVATETPVVAAPEPEPVETVVLWPTVFMAAMTLSWALIATHDPRPRAWRRLTDTLRKLWLDQ